MKRLIVSIFVILVTLFGASPAFAGPQLNYPNGTETEKAIIFSTMTKNIASAVPGSVIMIENPAMSYGIKDALLAAHARGVNVRVILAAHAPNGNPGLSAAAADLVAALGTNVAAKSFVHVCPAPYSCNGRAHGGGMHAKTLLISNIGNGVTFTDVTSQDLIANLMNKEFDTAYSTVDPDVFAYEKSWFNSQLDNVATDFPTGILSNGLYVNNFPQVQSTVSNNYYTRTLAPITCVKDNRHTVVHLATSLWSPLLKPLAWRMVHLAHSGCHVKVILNKLKTARNIVRILTDHHVPFRYSNNSTFHSHVKEIAVRGWFNGRWVSTVAVGSTNPSITEMKYFDDNMVRIQDNDGAFDTFKAQFGAIWKLGNTKPLPASKKVVVLP